MVTAATAAPSPLVFVSVVGLCTSVVGVVVRSWQGGKVSKMEER